RGCRTAATDGWLRSAVVYSRLISAGTNVSAPGPGQIVRIRNRTDVGVVGVIDPSGTLSRLSRANTFCGPFTSIIRGIFGSTVPDASSATILSLPGRNG